MQKILIVEDDLAIQALLHDFIQEAGYEVTLASDGVEALSYFSERGFDLVLLDIMLPKIDGYGVCEVIRRKSNIPIVMLTALDAEENQIKGLDLEADDYITKPFSMSVLIRKIAAILRRSSQQEDMPHTISYRDLTLDLDGYKVYTAAGPIDLTPREFEILRELLTYKGRILTRQNLLQTLWKYEFFGDERIIDTHIKNLRKKLGTVDYIETIRGVGYRILIKKIKSKLAVKVFIISALLMAFCCGITYFFILHFAPYIYSYTPSDVEWLADEHAQELSMTDKGETAIYFSIANDTLTGDYNNEYLFHLFNSDGEEVSLTDTATATGKQIDDYNPKETSAHYTVSFIGEERPYTLLLAKNTDKESQAVEALHKALPALTIVIVAISVLAAVFYAWYMTAPIKKISKMSKQMANMDFGSLCPVERTDEIGVLSDSLNTLSSNLSAALTELKDANQKLQADIDKERELELQRIKFFSAASHELKTPITIIKGQLQGMLCGVGRYKDRETYLAQSLEVTNSLEKMVQELLTVSRIEAPQYSCVKTHFDFTQFLRQRLAAFDDLFVQKELSVAINLLPDIYIDGDIGLLQKVVDNLLGNAATYSPPGNSVRVDLRQAEEKVYLTIENTGVHIPEDDISKLFEPFYRVEQSRNRQTGGSGLGLYIVKTIINLHNAEISVQNTDDGVAIKVIF